MRIFTLSVVLSLLFVAGVSAQSIKHLERKARKTIKKEAYGMALYYSQAILQLDAGHAEALNWAEQASLHLHLSGPVVATTKPNPAPKQNANLSLPGLFEGAFPEPKPKRTSKTHHLIVRTFDAVDSTALTGTYIGLTNDGFGEGQFYQNEPDGNIAFFEIPDGAFFTITGTKNAYLADIATVLTEGSAPDTLIRNLYLSPSWKLPISLYFDYDQPASPSPADTVTEQTYEGLWLRYLSRVDEYIDGYVQQTNEEEKAKAQRAVSLFFVYEIDGNYLSLNALCRHLHAYLKTGKKTTLILEGYAGAMEKTDFAHALIARRFNSLENYLVTYENGLLKPWLDNGQLLLKRIPMVQNDKINLPVNDKKGNGLSIFDPAIARSRKVVIKSVVVE